MEWIKRIENEPEHKLGQILVWGKCGGPHVAYCDYGSWNHTECCCEGGGHFIGDSIDFDFWMPIPNQPERLSPKDVVSEGGRFYEDDQERLL